MLNGSIESIAAGEIQIDSSTADKTASRTATEPLTTHNASVPSAFTSKPKMRKKVNIAQVVPSNLILNTGAGPNRIREAPPRDQRKQVASYRAPGQATLIRSREDIGFSPHRMSISYGKLRNMRRK